MISKLLYAFEHGVLFVRKHPPVLFSLFLVIVLPLAFFYSSNQFLQAGQTNTDTLVYQRIGLLNDVFSSLVLETNFDSEILQKNIEEIVSLNKDITKFRVVIEKKSKLIPIASLDRSKIGQAEKNKNLYEKAFSEPSGITFPFTKNNKKYIQSFRAIRDKNDDKLLGYIFIETDQTALNSVLKERKQTAYISLFILYLVLLGLTFWLAKITNYRYLYDQVKKTNEMKDFFTNMIAHELRAPLTAIKGYASLSVESTESPDYIKYSSRIKESADRLITIVSDLLDVARIQSGKFSITNEEVNLSSIIGTVTEELEISATEKNIKLINSGTDAEHIILGDKKRLHQAMTNLLSNSIKYTKEGEINISIEEKRKVVEIRVKDSGMGISAKDQKKLFEPFFRAENSDVSQITGTGLGMWITRQMIELMQGTIEVESIKGVGTHVVVTFPKVMSSPSK